MTRNQAGRFRTMLALVLTTGLATFAVHGCARSPQFGDAQSCVQATDALWTAVSSRDAKLLDDCERYLTGLKSDGDLTSDAYEYLQTVVRNARQGDWDRARTALKRLIDDQRAT